MDAGFFGPLGDRLEAASASELRRLLSQVDPTVPPRTEGRTSEDRERYAIFHYLQTLRENGLLEFPFRICKGESPDFVVEMSSERFGLEVTEAGSQGHQRAATALEKAPVGSWLEEGGGLRLPGQPLSGRGFVGDEPERLWTEEVLREIRQKAEKKLPKYQELPAYELLVYDNTSVAAVTSWTVDELPARLAEAIRGWEESETSIGRRFRRISVLRDRVLMYDVTGAASLIPVPLSSGLPSLLPLTLLGVQEEMIRAFCRRHRIRKVAFFGSVAGEGERFGPDSDVDVLVAFEPGHRIGLLGIAGLEIELGDLLGRKVDLRTVFDLSRYFREEVAREKSDLVYVAG